MTRASLRSVLAAVLALAGIGALGHAAWIPAKAALGQRLLEDAWDRLREGEADARPWPWADTEPVARLRRLRGGASVLVLAGASGRTLAWGPGHLSGTPLPGTRGNAVVAGHRDTHFAFLEDLEPGDLLEIETPEGALVRYRVRFGRVVHESDTRLLRGEAGRKLTLVTCYPFEAVVPGGPLRYLVRAEAVTGPPSPRGARPGGPSDRADRDR